MFTSIVNHNLNLMLTDSVNVIWLQKAAIAVVGHNRLSISFKFVG